MIIVKLIGGLGNQMFQYACGKSLAIKNNTSLKIDITSLLDKNSQILIKRDYELDIFNITADLASDNNLLPFYSTKNYFEKLFKIIFRKNYLSYLEPHFNYDATIFKLFGNIYIDGYWQSEKYFKEINSSIRKDFTFKGPLIGDNLFFLNKIQSTNSVSIHFRRGDYVTNPQTNNVHCTCSKNYYLSAIAYVKSKINNPHFFIFSDEIEWVKNNFYFQDPHEFVDINFGKKCFQDMRLMSSCSNNIIANSSFSWWAAWLNTNKNKIVIAPQKWFNDSSINTQDLIPEDWIRI